MNFFLIAGKVRPEIGFTPPVADGESGKKRINAYI